MTLEEFLANMRATMDVPLQEFETMWRAENAADPVAYPLEMDEQAWTGKFMPFFLSVAAKKMSEDG
jgi:hypothetical protein